MVLLAQMANSIETGLTVGVFIVLVRVVEALVKWRNGKNGKNGKIVTVDCSRAIAHQQILDQLDRVLLQTDADGALLVYSPKKELRDIATELREVVKITRQTADQNRDVLIEMREVVKHLRANGTGERI